ncbi:molybdopterin molybdotransferase MoeA, partial [Escherichia coli]
SDAVNRVLAHDLRSPVNVPRFDQSAMDGYAVFAEDIREASAKFPVSLEVIGTILPGDKNVYRIRPGQAISVATGARIPLG